MTPVVHMDELTDDALDALADLLLDQLEREQAAGAGAGSVIAPARGYIEHRR